jgi:hypothetical protein
MNIQILARRLALSEGLRRYVTRRIEDALERHRVWIERVEVQFGEAGGRDGRGSKFCRVMVRLAVLPPLVIRDLGSDLHEVIGSAAERAGQVVGRRMEQRIGIKRRMGMGLAAA